MKTKIFTILTLLMVISLKVSAQDTFPYKLTQIFQTNDFEAPESVIKDEKNKVYYVSNVNGNPGYKDGNGYISKLGLDGKVIQKKWAVEMDAPKGMALYKGDLYVADIDRIIQIDTKNGQRKNVFPAQEATFLNDVTASDKGEIYVSNTFGFGGIYKLANGKVTLWFKDEQLNNPNGLLVKGNDLYLATWGANPNPQTFATDTPGKLLKIDLTSKKVSTVADNLGNLDGLVATVHGFMMTDWVAGKLLYYSEGKSYTALTLKQGSADIGFDEAQKLILVPQMLDGQITAYKLSK